MADDFKNLAIGKKFEYEGKLYEVEESSCCNDCAFLSNRNNCLNILNLPRCSGAFREDGKNVVFVEVK